MNLDRFFDKIYNEKTYNCVHFACDVWKEIKGGSKSLENALDGLLTGKGSRRLHTHALATLERVAYPSGPCLALFQLRRKVPHVGIWIDGKIIHLEESGVKWTEIENVMINFTKVRFYNVKENNNC